MAFALIIGATVIGILFALVQLSGVSAIQVDYMLRKLDSTQDPECAKKLFEIYGHITAGAKAFLFAEYRIMAIFVVLFGALVFYLTSMVEGGMDFDMGTMTAVSFVVGAVTSIISGYIGMMVAVYANARTTIAAENADDSLAWRDSFNTAFRAGGVMGFSLCAIAMVMLFFLMVIFEKSHPFTTGCLETDMANAKVLFECVAGYGLGGSCIAMFGRVGGGIYTKAADVGADLAGKVVSGIPEDDPRNPATIADNVGDNVGDVAGMGSDLFGSLAESSCAAMVVASTSPELVQSGWPGMLYPLAISAVGIIVCMLMSFLATHISPVAKESDVEKVLKIQLFTTAAGMIAACYPLSTWMLPASFTVGDKVTDPIGAWACLSAGLAGGCIVGFITEYYTSHSYTPVREVAKSCQTGAATNIIYGLALGYKSAIIPISIISFVVYVSFKHAGMYGVALGALGFLGTLATCLSIDIYGPVCDNAGGIAEMAELPERVREKTDALDAAGNTTAAIGKGFAIGSAALVSLALFGGFITRVGETDLNILDPITFAALFMGAMLPYWFTAMCMKSVGTAAMAMVMEVKHQFETKPGLLEGTPGHEPPDHARCIAISTDASLGEMGPPGMLVILSPIITGTFFGVTAVAGLLVGALISGVQLAISQSNTGGAWDNAKKYVEKGQVVISNEDNRAYDLCSVEGSYTVHGKGTELHKAAVAGDTVGDPLKDTSGPAINIVMKLMAIIALVFADYFKSLNGGHGLLNITA